MNNDDALRQADDRVQAYANEAADAAQAAGEKNLADGGVCDFCSRPLEPGHFVVYVTHPMLATISVIDTEDLGTGTVLHVDDSNWAACETCDPIVAEGDPLKLTAHVLAHRDASEVEIPPEIMAIIHADIVDLYAKFFEGNPQRKDDR